MKKRAFLLIAGMGILSFGYKTSSAQISLLKDYINHTSAPIGIFQNIPFREGGFSSLYPVPETNSKEFWTISDRGVNVDAANANPAACHPTYDKIYGFPGYAPKIHRIRIDGDSIEILKTITMKRPNGGTASGLLNPTGYGSTELEAASTDTVMDCANFNSKIAAKDEWGIDSEGIVVDKQGNFWICEEGGPTIWKLNSEGIVIQRFTPYDISSTVPPIDVAIDSVFKYRKNNRGFEGIAITPNGKIYAIIQSPLLYPTVSAGENTQIHRIVEIDPLNNSSRMFVYLNDGVIGTGTDQIRLRDWKIGDMAAINNNEFLVIEAGARGTSDVKKLYKIDISKATPVHSGLYGDRTLEELTDSIGLDSNKILPVKKEFFMDLLANGWSKSLDKSEGLAIINDSTIAVGNDNDYGQTCPLADGIAIPIAAESHVFVFSLKGKNKLTDHQYPPYFTASVNLTGNNITIADGDTLPSVLDNTHFGNVAVGSSVNKDFNIQNTGAVNLLVNDVHFEGIHASEFSLLTTPSFPVSISEGKMISISVSFNPLQGGTRNAFLVIATNDPAHPVYKVKLESEATFTTNIQTAAKTERLKIYPNPANDYITVEGQFEMNEPVNMRLFNLQGKEVVSKKEIAVSNTNQRFEINTGSLSNGVYYVEIGNEIVKSRVKIAVIH